MKGETGTRDMVEAVKRMRAVTQEISGAKAAYESGNEGALRAMAREIGCEMALLRKTAQLGRLPVVNFAADGIATLADVALVMQLGCDGRFCWVRQCQVRQRGQKSKGDCWGRHTLPGRCGSVRG
jgi:pyridoxal 5'-phosphate synthase pdxS subunit